MPRSAHRSRVSFVSLLFAFLFVNMAAMNSSTMAAVDDADRAFAAGDFKKALEIWMLRAYEGDQDAQFNLGVMMAEGKGTESDPPESVFWYEQAAEQGHPEAQLNLGHAYLNGFGVAEDKVLALKWWQKAADSGFPIAQYNLGRAYYYGVGTPANRETAEFWFKKAAAQNEPQSKKLLAKLGVAMPQPAAQPQLQAQQVDTKPVVQIPGQAPVAASASLIDQTGTTTAAVPQPAPQAQEIVQASQPLPKPVQPTKQAQATETVVGVTDPVSQSVAAAGDQGLTLDNTPLARVTRPGTALRSAADRLATVVRNLPENTIVEITQNKGEWIRVRVPGGFPVWVEAGKVTADGNLILVTENRIRAYAAPGAVAGSVGLGSFSAGEQAQILNRRSSWYQVQGSEGITAWVPRNRLAPVAPDNSVAEAWVNQRGVVLDALRDTQVAQGAAQSTETLSEEITLRVEPAGNAPAVNIGSASNTGGAIMDPAFVGQPVLRTGDGVTRVHAAPNGRAPVLLTLNPRALIKQSQRRGEWMQVNVPGGVPVWVFGIFVKRENGSEGRIRGTRVRARALPSTGDRASVVGIFAGGESVVILEKQNDWVRVRAPESIGGWIRDAGAENVGAVTRTLVLEWEARRKRALGLLDTSTPANQLQLATSGARPQPSVDAVLEPVQEPVPAVNPPPKNEQRPADNSGSISYFPDSTQPAVAGALKSPGPSQQQQLGNPDPPDIASTATETRKTQNNNLTESANISSTARQESGRALDSLPVPTANGQSFNDNTWLYGQPASRFTVQLMSTRDPKEAANFIERYRLQQRARYFPSAGKSGLWFYVLNGSYGSAAAARDARNRLGDAGNSASIRNFGILQSKRCKNRDLMPREWVSDVAYFCDGGDIASRAAAATLTPRVSTTLGGNTSASDVVSEQKAEGEYVDPLADPTRTPGTATNKTITETPTQTPAQNPVETARDSRQVPVDEIPVTAMLAEEPKPDTAQLNSSSIANARPVTPGDFAGEPEIVDGLRRNDDKWLFSQSRDAYTLELVTSNSEDIAREFISIKRLEKDASYFGVNKAGESWYAAIIGVFNSSTNAKQAITRLNLPLRATWIRQFGELQQYRCNHEDARSEPLKTVCQIRNGAAPPALANAQSESVIVPEPAAPQPAPVPELAPAVEPATTLLPATVNPDGELIKPSMDMASTVRNGFPYNDNVWLYGQPGNYYTLQLMSARQEDQAVSFMRKNKLDGRATYFGTNGKNGRIYYVVVGEYGTLDAAENERSKWRAKSIQPWIRRFEVLQKNRCKAVTSLPADDAGALRPFCS